MTDKQHSVRHLVQADVAARLVAKADKDVSVLDGVVANDVKQETIGIGPVTSVVGGLTYLMAGRKMRQDTFTFRVQFKAAARGQKTPAIAKARAAEMFGWLEDILADDATLGGLCYSAQITAYDGPDSQPLPDAGFGGDVTATVQCDTRQN